MARTNASEESCAAGYAFFLRRGPQLCSRLVVNDFLLASDLDEISEHTYTTYCDEYEYGVQVWVPINRWEYVVKRQLERGRRAVS